MAAKTKTKATTTRPKKPATRKRRAAPRAAYQSADPVASANSPDDIERLIRESQTVDSGARVTDDSAMRVAAVYASIRVLSDAIAMLPTRVFKIIGNDDESKKLQRGHNVHKLLNRRPNRWQTPYEFKRMAIAHICMTGNAYALKVMKGGKVGSVLPLHPRRVEVEQDAKTHKLKYTYTKLDDTKSEFKQEQIWHMRGLSSDGIIGMSPIQAAAQAIGLSLQAEKQGARMFKSGLQNKHILVHPANVSEEAAGRLSKQIAEQHEGADNSGGVMVLEEGLTLQALTMTPEETQFMDSRRFQRSEIAMFFGVPPHMIGDVDKSTSWGSGIEQQGIGFVTYTLMPWLTNFAQSAERDLFTEKEFEDAKLFVETDTRDLTRADLITRTRANDLMTKAGAMSVNEWRRMEGRNPVDGGDEMKKAAPPQMAPPDNDDDQKDTDNGTGKLPANTFALAA